MYDFDQELYYARIESIIAFYITVIILYSCKAFILLFIYCFLGIITLLYPNEIENNELDDDDYDDPYEYYLMQMSQEFQDDTNWDSRIGADPYEDDIYLIMESAYEDLQFPDSYVLIETYVHTYLEFLDVPLSNESFRSASLEKSYKHNWGKYELVFSGEFKIFFKEAKGLDQGRLLRYKVMKEQFNHYLFSSFMAQGLYSINAYDSYLSLFNSNHGKLKYSWPLLASQSYNSEQINGGIQY